MSKPTKKQIAITADLIGRALHGLDELALDYAVVIDGIPTVFSNCKPLHRDAMIERAYMIANKIAEYDIETEAERRTVIPPERGEGLAGV